MTPPEDGPSVSALIDNFNYARYLGAALESALEQSYPLKEIVVADDGSTDDSCQVAERYAAQDGRIRLVRKQNGGQASAFNAAFAASTGDIVCLLDSDDVWWPGKVARMVEIFSSAPQALWVRHRLRNTDHALRPLGTVVPATNGPRGPARSRYHHLEKTVTFSTSTVCFRRGLAERLFPIPEAAFRHGPDLYLDFMCGVRGAPGYALDEELGFYRRHPAQMSARGGDFAAVMDGEIALTRAFLSVEPCQGYIPTHVYKHEMIASYLRSGRVFDQGRLRLCAAGLASVGRLAREAGASLALLQAAKLTYGLLLPRRWIKRQLKQKGWATT
jgi:glycosyltransferase involved in cell wall biosynthesis